MEAGREAEREGMECRGKNKYVEPKKSDPVEEKKQRQHF